MPITFLPVEKTISQGQVVECINFEIVHLEKQKSGASRSLYKCICRWETVDVMKSTSCGVCREVNISICKPQDHGLGGIFMLRMKNVGGGESLINPLLNVRLLLLATRDVLYHYLSFPLIMVKVGVLII